MISIIKKQNNIKKKNKTYYTKKYKNKQAGMETIITELQESEQKNLGLKSMVNGITSKQMGNYLKMEKHRMDTQLMRKVYG